VYWDGVDFGVEFKILVDNSIWGIPHRVYWDGVDFGVDFEILVDNSIWGIPHRVYWDGVDFGVDFKILVVNSIWGIPPQGVLGRGTPIARTTLPSIVCKKYQIIFIIYI
jgi:hypothetical protein